MWETGPDSVEMSSRLSSRTACPGWQTLTDCAVAANDCRLMSGGPWWKPRCIRREMHPAVLRCSSVEYPRYSLSSRLARRAPLPSRCDAGLPPRTTRSLVAHRAIVVVLLALAACGKKGPPLAPLRVTPARVEDLTVAKTGEEVRARFTVPSTNADKTAPADLVAVEVYGISGKPEDPLGNALGGPEFIRFAELVGRVQIAPPEIPGEEPPDPTRGSVAERARAAAEIAARQAQPAQGSLASVVEHLTRDDYTPFVHPDRRPTPPPPATTVLVRPLGPAPAEDPFSRTYVAICGREPAGEPHKEGIAV